MDVCWIIFGFGCEKERGKTVPKSYIKNIDEFCNNVEFRTVCGPAGNCPARNCLASRIEQSDFFYTKKKL